MKNKIAKLRHSIPMSDRQQYPRTDGEGEEELLLENIYELHNKSSMTSQDKKEDKNYTASFFLIS